MSSAVKIYLVFLVALMIVLGCSKQESRITGRIYPVTIGTRITALQNGKVISETEAQAKDGRFIVQLPPGAYDISVSVPGAPYPLIFHDIAVQEGRVTELARIDIPLLAGPRGGLSGRIMPPRQGVTLSLSAGGKERAVAVTDDTGKYQFRELSAGTYNLKADAAGYASESIPVIVPADSAVTADFTLFFKTGLREVDWTAGKIRVTGFGVAPPTIPSPTIRREMAKRAALSDAQRKLLKTLSEIEVGPGESLRSSLGEKNFTQTIRGFIKGYSIVREIEREKGALEVEVELPLTGAGGLSHSIER